MAKSKPELRNIGEMSKSLKNHRTLGKYGKMVEKVVLENWIKDHGMETESPSFKEKVTSIALT